MPPFDELHMQNHKLIETSNVLLYLFQERAMCDTETACNLLYNFMDAINEHLGLVDSLYQGLLADNNMVANNTARQFMSGEQELKRIIARYAKSWCMKNRQQLKVYDHEKFKLETQALFKMVLTRIQNETELLYPLVRDIGKVAA